MGAAKETGNPMESPDAPRLERSATSASTTQGATLLQPDGTSPTASIRLESFGFPQQITLLVCVQAIICFAAFALAGTTAALAAAVAAIASLLLCVGFAYLRHREAMRLVGEIDEVLHAGRRVSFTDCREGDMAVLRNEVSKMTARLCRTADQLEREKTALADALANVSHQIRTPLTAIQLMTPIIERTQDPETRTRKLHELEHMVDRVSWLITALLKMARLDAGSLQMRKEPVDAAAAVCAALKPFEIAMDVRNIECAVRVESEALFEGDASWTIEAVSNIVKNCMEHTPPDGTVLTQVGEDATAVRIRVSDTGSGIAETDLPHVFERFYCGAHGGEERAANAADDLTPPPTQGFGIGLSLAQSCVSAQGGTLRAFNLPQGGACFEMTFPKMTV